jgi:hypothetical protein
MVFPLLKQGVAKANEVEQLTLLATLWGWFVWSWGQ